MQNSKIKNFDTEMGAFINSYLNNGIEISMAVIVLEKYLMNAREVEKEVIEQEKKAEESNKMPIEDIPSGMPNMMGFSEIPESMIPTDDVTVVESNIVESKDEEYVIPIGYGEDKNDEEMDPDWDMK